MPSSLKRAVLAVTLAVSAAAGVRLLAADPITIKLSTFAPPHPPWDVALQAMGARVRAFDPEGMEQAKKLMEIETCADAYETMKDADGLVLLTEWNEFRALNLVRVGELLKQKLIVDLRNIYAPEQMRDYGFSYVSIGRAPALAKPALAVAAE